MVSELRITAGIEASMITPFATCRFVMPASESTIARGALGQLGSERRPDLGPSASEPSPSNMAPSPPLASRPAAASASPYVANARGKNARTTCPKMSGSEIFVIVVLRWTENSTPSALARTI